MAREGFPFVGYGAVVGLVLGALGIMLNIESLFILSGVAWFFTLFSAYFFRDPERNILTNDLDILSPGDGRVISIVEENEAKYFNGPVRRVSVFLSVFNVHVNRTPIKGEVTYLSYKPGKFLAAFDEKSSFENEQSIIGIAHENKKVLFKQIAGLIARRIIFRLDIGQQVEQGERFGLIRFGSRVDILFPMSAEVLVKKGDKVTGGISVIGRYKDEA